MEPWVDGSHDSLALKGRDFMTPLQGLDLFWTSNPGFHPGLSPVAPPGADAEPTPPTGCCRAGEALAEE